MLAAPLPQDHLFQGSAWPPEHDHCGVPGHLPPGPCRGERSAVGPPTVLRGLQKMGGERSAVGPLTVLRGLHKTGGPKPRGTALYELKLDRHPRQGVELRLSGRDTASFAGSWKQAQENAAVFGEPRREWSAPTFWKCAEAARGARHLAEIESLPLASRRSRRLHPCLAPGRPLQPKAVNPSQYK